MRWFRAVWRSFFGWVDLVSRIEVLEERFDEIELSWTDQYDKLLRLHQRANKRIQDGASALMTEAPTKSEIQIGRRAQLAALRAKHLHAAGGE